MLNFNFSKNALATSIFALFASCNLLANDAILNVEGEIQINGKTVITSDGVILDQPIDLTDYDEKPGTYSYYAGENCEGTDTTIVTVANNITTKDITEHCSPDHDRTVVINGDTSSVTYNSGEYQRHSIVELNQKHLFSNNTFISEIKEYYVENEFVQIYGETRLINGPFEHANENGLSFNNCISLTTLDNDQEIRCADVGTVNSLVSYAHD